MNNPPYLSVIFHSLPAFCKSAIMAYGATACVFNSTSALRASANEHNLLVSLLAISIPIVSFLEIPFKRLCYRIGTGGYLTALYPDV